MQKDSSPSTNFAIRPALLAGVDESNPPRLGDGVVHGHLVGGHVEGDVGGVQEVVGEVLLDDVALIAAADDEVVDAVTGVNLEDVPEDGQAPDFNHRFGPQRSFLADSGAETACKNNCLHRWFPKCE